MPPSKPLQFSVRSLLLLVTVLALALALQRCLRLRLLDWLLPVWIMAVVVALGTLSLYCRGHRQTMFLGALVPAVLPLVIGWQVAGVASFALYQFVAAVVGGVTATATRRFLERRGWDRTDAADGEIP
ncbi:MAG: hypothetical protein DCC67_18385 [Planctomycetota bacterium]|nr:MAG: hypothetical protein DCC67_18385 [Planctomycetota bacterium]